MIDKIETKIIFAVAIIFIVLEVNFQTSYVFSDTESATKVHDVAITNVSFVPSQVYEGQIVRIEVTVKNLGDFPEKFNVTLYANGTSETVLIDTYFVASLGSTDQIAIPFVWDTIRVTPENYTITAEASAVEGETNVADNIKTGGILWIKADNTAPIIDVPVQEPLPDAVWEWDWVKVSVNVTDVGSGIAKVILSWKFSNETVWQNTTMINSGGETFTEYIPGYGGGNYISYRILAYDKTGNEAIRDHGGRYYVYYIIAEFPAPLTFFILAICAMLITLFTKKGHSEL